MSRRTVNLLLLAAFVASLGMDWQLRPRPTLPNREFIPEMVRTPRYNAFSANPNFLDGKTLQLPPAGTIPRGYLPIHFASSPQDASRAGLELASPFHAGDAQAISRGAVVYGNFCQPCHGSAGKGNGPVVERGYPAPPSLLAEHALNVRDGQIFHILTYGQKNMPSYAAQISRQDRWSVIAYVHSLQKQAQVAPTGGRP